MKRWLHLFPATTHLFLVTLFGLPLITPLMRWTAVACTHDGHLHYHRIAALRHAWENGLYFGRWLPDLAFGYGYPFLIYREPLPLYAGLFPHLSGLPLPATSNVIYGLCILAGGWFMYLWVREVMGERAGLVSAVCYMAAPYVLVDALVRGNLPESLALPLFPFLLWQGRRWMLTGTAQSFLLSVLGLAALALSHNISLLLFTPTLFIYLCVIAYKSASGQVIGNKRGARSEEREVRSESLATSHPSPLASPPSLLAFHPSNLHPLIKIFLLFALGLGVTFFYSGGAVLEMDAVTLQQSTTTRNNDFRYNFASLEEILAPVSPEDPNLINPPLLFRLGWVPVGLAALGVVSFFWRRRAMGDGRWANDHATPISNLQSLLSEQNWHIGLMVVGTAVFLFMALPLSKPIWEALPLIDFVQFPWRFVGRAALPIAFLAGVPFTIYNLRFTIDPSASSGQSDLRLGRNKLLFTVYCLLLTLPILEAFPLLYPNYCQEKPFPTINDVHAYEYETGLVGVDPEGSYFPRTVGKRPSASPLETDYQNGRIPQRFDLSLLPEGAAVRATEYGNNIATLHLTTPTAFTARYLTFAFPGWVAEVDGRSVPIIPSDPEGLITFPVPAGEHTLTVRWGTTPLRMVLMGVSLASLVGLLVISYWLWRRRVSTSLVEQAENLFPVWPFMVLAVCLIGVKWGVVDQINTPFRRPAAPPVAQTAVLQANELRLEGYNLSQNAVEAGETFDIDLAWTAVSPPAADYQSNVWLVGPEGLTWSEKETQRPRLYEAAPQTRLWLPGQWAWDSREVQVLSGTPPGEYDIVLTLFDLATLQPLTLRDVNGAVVGPTAVIGRITVTMPDTPPEFAPQYPFVSEVEEPRLTLLGYSQDRTEAAPGDLILLTLFWERPSDLTELPQNFTLHLMANGRSITHTWQLPITRPDFTNWQPGQRLRGQYLLRLPASLDSGDYQFNIHGTQFGLFTLRAPERIFTQPEMETAVQTLFTTADGQPQITLVGYTLSNLQSPNLSISLLWKANTEMTPSYHVFIHLVDETGQIIAQSDGEPANWTRPTTGWTVGEYIIDAHQFTLPAELPPGPLFLRIGLYEAETGERLRAETADFISISLVGTDNH